MGLYDQHVHSNLSTDCFFTMGEMAAAAARAGLSGVTFTDHCDIENYKTGEVVPDCFNAEERRTAYEKAVCETGEKIDIRFGVEVGSVNHRPDIAEKVFANELDLIIASVHNLAGLPDFYTLGEQGELKDRQRNIRYIEEYAREHLELVKIGGFDVVGHIGYPIRYMEKHTPGLTMEPLKDIMLQIVKIMAEKGIALELNSSCVRTNMEWTPEPWIIKAYKDAGGEMVTLGSDSHEPQHIGNGFDVSAELLRSLGFRYITVFRQRKPEFIGI